MKPRSSRILWSSAALAATLAASGGLALAQGEDFASLVRRLSQEKPQFAKRQQDLLAQRYDLSDRPVAGVTMARGKPVQGVCGCACPRA
jgi:hypothetical protein